MSSPNVVMVVDDDEALRESVCEVLEDDGYTAVCIDGGSSALERLRAGEQKPSLILLDLMMPGMTGWDFREEQLHDPSLAPIPVVVMTASRELNGISANEVVFKPLTREKLLAVVHRHAQRADAPPAERAPADRARPRRRATDRLGLYQMFPETGPIGALLRSKKWSQTPLGPLEDWPRSLVSHMAMVGELPSPAIIFWGPEQTQLYNESYAQIMGPRHPKFFGEPYRDCWPDTYPVIYPRMQRVLEKGEVIRVEKELITVTRYGFPEEAYFTFTFSPLRDDSGAIAGIFQPVTEVTEAALSERRAQTIRALAPRAESLEPTKEVVLALSANDKDLPFFLIYVWDDSKRRLGLAGHSENLAELGGSAPRLEELARRVFESKTPLDLDDVESLFDGVHLGPWPESARAALVLPMSTADAPRGVVVFGLSPRLRLNEAYRRFLEVAAGQVAIATATTHALREAQRRAEALAETGREVRAQREQLYSMFMQAPVPICVFHGPDLVFEMANPRYEEVAGRTNVVGKTLLEAIPEARGQGVLELLRGVLDSAQPYVGKEWLVRLDRDHDGVLEGVFFNFIYAPIRNFEGVVDRVMAVVNDVTDQVLSRRRVEESEEKFRRIVTQVGAGIAQTDLTGRFTLTNERYREIVGRSAAELSQLRMQDLTHPDDLPANLEQIHKLVDQGTPFIIEKRYVRPDGTSVWVQNSVARIDDRDGRPQGIAAVTLDITQRKYAEQALKENETRFRQLVEQVKDYAIFRIDTQGRAVTWNEGVQRVLGFDEVDFIGHDVTDIFTAEDVQAGVPQLELKTAAREGSANNDRWMRRKNGERFAAAGITSALRGAAGELVGFTKVLRDQTEKVKAEEVAAHLAAIVTSSDDAIISTDLSGTVRSWNKGAEQLYGYLPEEVLGKPVALLVPEDRADEEPGILQRIERGEVVAHYETVRRRKDGTLLDVSLTVSPIQDAGRRIIGAAKIARDITFRKRIDEAMRQSEARFRAIFEGAEVSIWEEDFTEVKRLLERLELEQGPRLREFLQAHPAVVQQAMALVHVRDVNPATLRMFEAPRKDALLGSLSTIFLRETQAVFVEELIMLAEGKRLFSSEAAVWTLEGHRLDVLLTMSVPAGDATPARVLITLTDISAQKLAEVEREARVAEMERAVRFSEMFIGILGHDLRNPLSAISMAASLLSRGAETQKIARTASRILTSADRMERMISQLLDFTRVRLGRGIPLERTTVDLAEVCRVVIGEFEATAGCDVHIEQAGETHGNWDRDRLAQLISNLVANACHHGAQGRPIRVRVDGSRRDWVQIEVRNQGTIPAELMPVLFEPLRYKDDARSERRQRSSGLGLGLYITQQIVLAHGGELHVESDDSQGTRFVIDLPRHPPAEADRVFSAGE